MIQLVFDRCILKASNSEEFVSYFESGPSSKINNKRFGVSAAERLKGSFKFHGELQSMIPLLRNIDMFAHKKILAHEEIQGPIRSRRMVMKNYLSFDFPLSVASFFLIYQKIRLFNGLFVTNPKLCSLLPKLLLR